MRREERTGCQAPKRFRMSLDVLECGIHNVCFLACRSIKTHKKSSFLLTQSVRVTKYSSASLAGSSVDQATESLNAMSVPERMGSYFGDLALATLSDKARVYPSI